MLPWTSTKLKPIIRNFVSLQVLLEGKSMCFPYKFQTDSSFLFRWPHFGEQNVWLCFDLFCRAVKHSEEKKRSLVLWKLILLGQVQQMELNTKLINTEKMVLTVTFFGSLESSSWLIIEQSVYCNRKFGLLLYLKSMLITYHKSLCPNLYLQWWKRWTFSGLHN